MKRLTLVLVSLIVLSLATVVPTLAQNTPEVITLNDATPAIDVVVTLPTDTTGTIALDFTRSAVRLTDANGTVVFQAADPRLHGVELNIAPNTGTHTLTVERLPGVTEAYVRVTSLPELTQPGSTVLVSGLAISSNQEISMPLSADRPGDTVSVSIPSDSAGILSAMFPGAAATTQLVDASGVVMAQSNGGNVDGMNFVVDPGNYQFTVLGTFMQNNVVAGVRLVSANEVGVSLLQAPAAAVTTTTAVDTAPVCTATVAVSSTNLRSGPGTGYTILGYGYRGQVFNIGGRNPENNWLVIALDGGASAWVAASNVQVQGDCSTVATFNVPLQNAQPAPLVITTLGQSHEFGDDRGESGEREDGDD